MRLLGARDYKGLAPMERGYSSAAYVIILVMCGAGILRAPWWAVCAGACALMLISLTSNRDTYARYATVDDSAGQSVLIFSGALNASAASAAAFGLGALIGWLWGV